MQACNSFEAAAPVLNFRILRILIRILKFSSMHRHAPRQWRSLIAQPAVRNGYADGAATCGNDARQAVLLEPLPSGLNQGHRLVSPDGYGVRFGWRPALSRAVAI